MESVPFALALRMMQYAASSRSVLVTKLGAGKDGDVYCTSTGNALKFHRDATNYRRERDAYLRLRSRRVDQVNNFNIPQLINTYDRIQAIEMSIVRPPYILDFASARLDDDVDFSEDVMAEDQNRIIEQFGDRAADVFFLIQQLNHLHGILMLDARPANIAFE